MLRRSGLSRSRGSGSRLAGQLQPGLVEVVEVEVGVAEGVHEVARLEVADLGHHHRQHRVGGDVERHAEEDVARSLVELAGEPAVGDVELEQRVARRQRHRLEVTDVPRADDVAAAVGVGADLLDDGGDLVHRPAVRGRPGPPLVPVDRAELAASSAHSSQMLIPRSCSQPTLVAPRRNHSSSPVTERMCSRLVVTAGKPSARSNRIWWPNTLSVPVPVRSLLVVPSSRTRVRRSRYCRMRET